MKFIQKFRNVLTFGSSLRKWALSVEAISIGFEAMEKRLAEIWDEKIEVSDQETGKIEEKEN